MVHCNQLEYAFLIFFKVNRMYFALSVLNYKPRSGPFFLGGGLKLALWFICCWLSQSTLV